MEQPPGDCGEGAFLVLSSEHFCPTHGAWVQSNRSTLMQGLVKLLNAKDKIAMKSEVNKSREKNHIGFIFLYCRSIFKMYGNELDLQTLVWTHVYHNI